MVSGPLEFGGGVTSGVVIIWLAGLLKDSIKAKMWENNGNDRRKRRDNDYPDPAICKEHLKLVEKIHKIDNTTVATNTDVINIKSDIADIKRVLSKEDHD